MTKSFRVTIKLNDGTDIVREVQSELEANSWYSKNCGISVESQFAGAIIEKDFMCFGKDKFNRSSFIIRTSIINYVLVEELV